MSGHPSYHFRTRHIPSSSPPRPPLPLLLSSPLLSSSLFVLWSPIDRSISQFGVAQCQCESRFFRVSEMFALESVSLSVPQCLSLSLCLSFCGRRTSKNRHRSRSLSLSLELDGRELLPKGRCGGGGGGVGKERHTARHVFRTCPHNLLLFLYFLKCGSVEAPVLRHRLSKFTPKQGEGNWVQNIHPSSRLRTRLVGARKTTTNMTFLRPSQHLKRRRTSAFLPSPRGLRNQTSHDPSHSSSSPPLPPTSNPRNAHLRTSGLSG